MLPVLLVLAAVIVLSSKGHFLYRQQRIGLNGKPFTLYKLRSMRKDAEVGGPQTTSKHDPRITPVGAWLRRTRLDEFPQLWNVIRGDMSLVGPRPERQFFIDQIIQVAPEYYEILTIRPGITGWGQIKNGYAATLDQMLRRLRYDRLYLYNRSLGLDLKILWQSVAIVLMGRGR